MHGYPLCNYLLLPLIKGPKHESFGYDFFTPSVTLLMKSTVHGRRKTKIPAQKGCH
jgi:hypothetical protein